MKPTNATLDRLETSRRRMNAFKWAVILGGSGLIAILLIYAIT